MREWTDYKMMQQAQQQAQEQALWLPEAQGVGNAQAQNMAQNNINQDSQNNIK
jgi:hypothetical protein